MIMFNMIQIIKCVTRILIMKVTLSVNRIILKKLVPVPDSRLFTHMKYEQRFKWPNFRVAKGGTAAYSVNCLTVRLDILLREYNH